jgi:hypothetical protein
MGWPLQYDNREFREVAFSTRGNPEVGFYQKRDLFQHLPISQ